MTEINVTTEASQPSSAWGGDFSSPSAVSFLPSPIQTQRSASAPFLAEALLAPVTLTVRAVLSVASAWSVVPVRPAVPVLVVVLALVVGLDVALLGLLLGLLLLGLVLITGCGPP